MDNFKVPYGLDDSGELVSASNASKGNIYACPCCKDSLVFRDGATRSRHFAHPSSSNCSFESILHITAKRLINDVITKNALGFTEIELTNCCKNCGVKFNSKLPINTFTSAGEEIIVGEYICDVVGYRENTIALGVEIFNTHKVGVVKGDNLSIYWIELKAEDVLLEPTKWAPTQGKLKQSFCGDCKHHMQHILYTADRWGVNRSLYSLVKNPDVSAFIADTEKCFKCKEEIPVFWWKGVPFCEETPPEPRPHTIKYKYSKKFGGSYWVNTCANCSMLQGDNFIFLFDSAPFKGLPLSERATPSKPNVASVTSQFLKNVNLGF